MLYAVLNSLVRRHIIALFPVLYISFGIMSHPGAFPFLLLSTFNCYNYKEPVEIFTHIFLAAGAASYPAGALTAPLRPPAGLFTPSVVPTLKISLALHLPCRQLAINLA